MHLDMCLHETQSVKQHLSVLLRKDKNSKIDNLGFIMFHSLLTDDFGQIIDSLSLASFN